VSWDNPTDHAVLGPDLLRGMKEQMVKIGKNLKATQDRKKSCANKGKTHRDFKVGDHVFLKVKARHSSLKLGNCSKLVECYCGPFEILERIGYVAYMLAFIASLCIHNVFLVSFLKNCVPDVYHIIDWNVIQVEPEGNFQVRLVCILDRKIKHLWNRVMEMVKVQWTSYGSEDATWEGEDSIQVEYPHIYEGFLNFCMYMCI
jgi:hypothetical protein